MIANSLRFWEKPTNSMISEIHEGCSSLYGIFLYSFMDLAILSETTIKEEMTCNPACHAGFSPPPYF